MRRAVEVPLCPRVQHPVCKFIQVTFKRSLPLVTIQDFLTDRFNALPPSSCCDTLSFLLTLSLRVAIALQ